MRTPHLEFRRLRPRLRARLVAAAVAVALVGAVSGRTPLASVRPPRLSYDISMLPNGLRAAYVQQPGTIVPQEGAPVQALLDQVIAAKGGLDVLRGVKNIVATTEADSDTPNGPVQAKTTTYLQYPNRVRVETTIPAGTVTQIYDGARAWVKDARGVHDVPQEMARELDASFSRDVIALLLAAHDGRVRPRLLPDVRADDRRTYHVLEFSSPSLDPTILYIDLETNLIARQSYVAGGPAPRGRAPVQRPIVEEIFSDYRPVSGVQVAYTALVRQGGQRVLERHVTRIRINEPLDPSLFTRPTP